jgi:hypothetical protein
MNGRLAHEIAGHEQFFDYFKNTLPARLTDKTKTKIYRELDVICNYPSHKYNVDCPNHCEAKFYDAINADHIRHSQTLKTIYLEILRDYEYEYKIEINDNNA